MWYSPLARNRSEQLEQLDGATEKVKLKVNNIIVHFVVTENFFYILDVMCFRDDSWLLNDI